VANSVFQSPPGRLERIPASRSEQARPMPVRTGARRLIAMSQLEEAVARLTQARSKLAPIADRILDIETMLAVTAAVDTERPSAKKISLREFTSNFLNQNQPRSPSTVVIEKYGMASTLPTSPRLTAL
jgi:hypothetical protein